MAIGPERIGKRPGIVTVGLSAAGMLAFAVAPSAHRIDRIHGHGTVDELIDDHAEACLDGYAKLGISRRFVAPEAPASGGVLDLEVGHNLTSGIDDDDVMVIARPVKASEVGEFLMMCHGSQFALGLDGLRLATTARSCCYRSFESLRSIRPWGGSLRTGRCPSLNLREMSETRPCRVRGAAAISLR